MFFWLVGLVGLIGLGCFDGVERVAPCGFPASTTSSNPPSSTSSNSSWVAAWRAASEGSSRGMGEMRRVWVEMRRVWVEGALIVWVNKAMSEMSQGIDKHTLP